AGQGEAQAADEVGDVLVYEVSGRVSPLCPGQFATLTQQQLHDALFLPALQLSRRSEEGAPGSLLRPGRLEPCAAGGANCALSKAASALLYCGVVRTCAEGACFQGSGTDIAPDDVATSLYYYQALAQATAPSTVAPAACGPVPMSVHLSTLVSEAVTATSAAKFIETQPWNAPTLGAPASAETAADLRAFFDRHPRGICLFMRGIDVERAREAEMAAQTLAFPVFAPFDPRLPSRATPLLRSVQRAAFDDEVMGALLGRCEPGAEKACRLKRERVASQLRASVGKLQTPLTNLAADEVPFHIGASGPFHLADSDALHVTLESSAEVPKAKGDRKSTRLNSSHGSISYAVFCLTKKITTRAVGRVRLRREREVDRTLRQVVGALGHPHVLHRVRRRDGDGEGARVRVPHVLACQHHHAPRDEARILAALDHRRELQER